MTDQSPELVEVDDRKVFLYDDTIFYVQLLDVLGDEFQPAEAARMSTRKGRLGPGPDARLQRYLLTNQHWSPFEAVVVTFELCIPIFVRAELDRHRTVTKTGESLVRVEGTPEEAMRKWFARNEASARYIQLPPEYYFPSTVRMQSQTNKQGGGFETMTDEQKSAYFLERCRAVTAQARELYDWAIEAGIERGLARLANTQNQATWIRYTGSLKNWLDVLALRLGENVLWECRRVAEAIEYLLTRRFPTIMTDWRDTVYDTVRLTASEVRTLLAVYGTQPILPGLASDEYEDAAPVLEKMRALLQRKERP